jgi:hypothetical protein
MNEDTAGTSSGNARAYAVPIVQAQTALPQPALERYSIAELYLFREYTRDTFEQEFGMQAPGFDPARPVKTWADVSRLPSFVVQDSSPNVFGPGLETVTYQVVRKSGNTPLSFVLAPFIISAQEAGQVNLPGAYRYDAYKPDPTPAVVGSQPLNPNYLTTLVQADQLQHILGSSVVVGIREGIVPQVPGQPINWNGELRRPYELVLKNGRTPNVGLLLLQRHAGGFNCPGYWRLDAAENPRWEKETQVTAPLPGSPGPFPVPCRDLLPNEVLEVNSFSAAPFVRRTDMGGGGTGTGGDSVILATILDKLTKLSKLFGLE